MASFCFCFVLFWILIRLTLPVGQCFTFYVSSNKTHVLKQIGCFIHPRQKSLYVFSIMISTMVTEKSRLITLWFQGETFAQSQTKQNVDCIATIFCFCKQSTPAGEVKRTGGRVGVSLDFPGFPRLCNCEEVSMHNIYFCTSWTPVNATSAMNHNVISMTRNSTSFCIGMQ